MRPGTKSILRLGYTGFFVFASIAALAQVPSSLGATHKKPGMQSRPSPPLAQPPFQTARPKDAAQLKHPATPTSAPSGQAQPQTVASVPTLPATTPRVSYSNGELTVLAENSSLSEVLNAIRTATGIEIEGGGGGADRVMARIGPAPVRDVLLSLLEGSRYDFAMLGSLTNPQKIDRLVLSAKVQSNGSVTVTAQPVQQQPEVAVSPDAGEEDDNEGFAPAPKPPVTNPGQVKTPEQLLEDLRRLEEERQQQQQQPADPNAPRPTRPVRPKGF